MIRLFRLNPTYFAFLGGVFVTTSINLYTAVYAYTSTPPTRWKPISFAALCSLISGACFSAIAFKLEPIHKLAFSKAPRYVDEQKEWTRLLSTEKQMLTILLVVGLASAAAGILLLQIYDL